MKWGRKPAKRSEADLLGEIAEGVHGIEAIFDPGLRLRWISPSIERMTGFSPAACMAAEDAFALLAFESDRDFCRRMVGQVLADGLPQDFELRLATRDGRTVWVTAHWRRRAGSGEGEGEGEGGLRLSAEDIGARKQTEYTLLETVAELRRAQALREHYLLRSNDERQRLAALLNLIRLGILFMDQDRRVLYHNRAMLEIWGYPPDAQLVGSREAVLKDNAAAVVADPQAYFAHIDEAVRERSVASAEYEIRFADGRIVTDRSSVVRGGDDARSIGRIGGALAQKAHALGMQILAYDPYACTERLPDYVKLVSLEELLRQSDVVSIHCPLTDETRNLLNESTLRLMKPTAYLVNTSRGHIVNEAALEKMLAEKRLAGAAFDVLGIEPASADHPLFKYENFLCTPHMAWHSTEAAQELKRKAAEEVRSVLRGEAPRYQVNKM